MRSHTCEQCGLVYDLASKATYCETADLDPRVENSKVASGLIATRWIPTPITNQKGDQHNGKN